MIRFDLNPRLEGDSLHVTDLPLCAVRLMKDANYPWVLLVPRHSDLIEIIDLSEEDRLQLMREIARVSEALRAITACEKLNVGALGNMVSQLHLHIIARFHEDPAWPGPVWGAVPAKPYEPGVAEDLINRLRAELDTGQNTGPEA
ncbi:HIT domain-containing protein [Pannonibacter phragmitetus]|uniref:Diadenosine tetraphosphate hydrolase n=1 Tax=Pannonibacter phragmitetus TaxID=121719 RepID=A0A0U3QBJ6_9HYPH|nr:HIT family protein [Pannonibacter phragmitetus]ALV29881.1 diadenosine tetraphosphate hydrolase [Pannonibacter phragmitetus]